LARRSWYGVVVLHGIAKVLGEGVIINVRYLYDKQAGKNNRDVMLIGIPLFEGNLRWINVVKWRLCGDTMLGYDDDRLWGHLCRKQ
jgi:hypothetical protein